MAQLLELRGISKTFPGVKALDNVNIDLNANEVLGLCGENGAGKSTLMKILTGIYTADKGGEIYLDGKKVTVSGPTHAEQLGLAIIHQELNLVGDLTVAQNIYLGRRGLTNMGVINDAMLVKKTAQLFERLNMNLDPRATVRDLSVAKQQMVEIAKALSRNARILVMDEPTAALTEAETLILFDLIRDFVTPETGLVYISHRMPEIQEITDRVSVLRDGQYVGTIDTTPDCIPEVISMMVGREIEGEQRPTFSPSFDEIALKVENLSTRNLLKNVSFELKRGEILGFAGLMGAGRTEVARCIFGADPRTSGEFEVFGQPMPIRSPKAAKEAGIGYLSEDRKRFGVIVEKDVRTNVAMASMKRFSNMGIINDGAISKVADEMKGQLNIKTPSVFQLLNNLSGGNQQKAVIAKWLIRDCDILIFDEPTRGIDVGAKEEIYELLESLAAAGKSIIMISSELPEVLRLSHRIVVMAEGEVTGIIDNAQATQENIMELATAAVEEQNGEVA